MQVLRLRHWLYACCVTGLKWSQFDLHYVDSHHHNKDLSWSSFCFQQTFSCCTFQIEILFYHRKEQQLRSRTSKPGQLQASLFLSESALRNPSVKPLCVYCVWSLVLVWHYNSLRVCYIQSQQWYLPTSTEGGCQTEVCPLQQWAVVNCMQSILSIFCIISAIIWVFKTIYNTARLYCL